MKMYLCMFLSALASTTAAPTLREVAEQQWSSFLAGDIPGWIATFADDAKVDWTLNGARFYGQVGQNGYTIGKLLTQITAQFEFPPPSRDGDYFSDNGHTFFSDLSAVMHDKISGSRQFVRMIYRAEINEAGLVSSGTWTPYSVEDIDASSVGTKMYTGWAASDPAVMDLFDAENFVLRISGNRIAELNGRTNGLAEFGAYVQKVENFYSHQDLSQLDCKVSASSPDGLSASAICSADLVYKSGAKMRGTVYQTWTVNSAGKIVSLDSVTKTDTALNARAAWDLTIDKFYAGNLQGVFDDTTEDLTLQIFGDAQAYIKHSPIGEILPNFSAGDTMSKKEYVEMLPKSLAMAPVQKLEFTYLAQSDFSLTVRYDIVTKYQGNVVSMIVDHEFGYDDDFQMNTIHVYPVSITAVPEKGGL